jgi:hypothetical protein
MFSRFPIQNLSKACLADLRTDYCSQPANRKVDLTWIKGRRGRLWALGLLEFVGYPG